MAIENSEENRREAGLLIAQKESNWKQPWSLIKHNKDLLRKEGFPLVVELGRAPLPTEFGNWTYMAFGDYTEGSHHELLIYGNFDKGSLGDGQNVLLRIHSACRTNEVYHAVNCECRKEVEWSMKLIAEEGRGALIYLEQEGRGTGIAGKMQQLNRMFGWEGEEITQNRDPETKDRIDTDRAYREAGLPSETRDFDVAGEMLKYVGITSVRLLTNNPAKTQGIASAGIQVEPIEIHIKPDNDIIAADLKSKAQNLNHNIRTEDWNVK